MRLAAFALALLALPAAAQPALPDSATRYLSPIFGMGGSNGIDALVVGVEAGQRISPTLDVGLLVVGGDNRYGPGGRFLTLGPTAGYTRALGAGVEFDARAQTSVTFSDVRANDLFGVRSVGAVTQATLSRPLRLVGSLRVAPTVGGYLSACQTVGVEVRPGVGCAEAGVLVGADLRFRLFGADVSVPVVAAVPLAGNDAALDFGTFGVRRAPVTAGIRIKF